jgi:integrase
VSLPSIAVDALVRHRWRQTVATLDGLVFPSLVGTPIAPRNLQRHWHGLRAGMRLDEVRLHDLRHSAASLLLVGGVPMRAEMETLGHSSIALKADTYSHVLDEVRRDVATRMDGVLGGRGSHRGSHAEGGQPKTVDFSRARQDSNLRPWD